MSLKEVTRLHGHKAGVTCLAAGQDNRDGLVFSGSDDQSSRLWDARSGRNVLEIAGFDGDITGVDFVGEHGLAVACGSVIYVYDRRSLEMKSNPQRALTKIKSVDEKGEIQSISTRGDFIAYVDEDGNIGVSDYTDAGDPTQFSERHDGMASCVCFHAEDLTVATGGFDQCVRVWDISSEKVIVSGCAQSVEDPSAVKIVNPPFVYTLDFAPDEHCTVVSGHADGRLMCLNTEECWSWPDCHSYSISALQFLRSAPNILATAGLDCAIRLWDVDAILQSNVSSNEGGISTFPPNALFSYELLSKPNALVSSEHSGHVYLDQDNSIVLLALQ
ncbi:WD40 repeat-like protein [Coemansia reversa NRRL 1564]|uniref:WD40 repeat-like protein n=1 Tax=Coemansia reversa (strain ATCC 12441 / NRRL 1564) TaxID=763665 RepID=A0A2G5BGJ0_COERN|nr:WD40 repeat-like protein [Coemansia reversa NRRL 1564]|eukprot:PIA18125.1 WD40 repeat-like protein [Coemansia reversa NRRL 1564]